MVSAIFELNMKSSCLPLADSQRCVTRVLAALQFFLRRGPNVLPPTANTESYHLTLRDGSVMTVSMKPILKYCALDCGRFKITTTTRRYRHQFAETKGHHLKRKTPIPEITGFTPIQKIDGIRVVSIRPIAPGTARGDFQARVVLGQVPST